MSKLLRVFRDSKERISISLFLIFLLINMVVFLNSALHSPFIGYDMDSHLINIEKLSHFSWPNNLESPEFFSPPLPYVIPALALSIGGNIWWASKIGQLCNVILSLGTTYYLLVICDHVLPGQTRIKLFSLGLLGMLPVYYKTFSQMRGEPYLVFLALFVTEYATRLFIFKEFTTSNIIKLGFGLAALALARQWGFFVFPAVFICAISAVFSDSKNTTKIIKAITIALAISAIIGGGFYLYLLTQYGTILAFNRSPDKEPKPISFYIGGGDGKLFIDPIRPNFARQAIPILYSEMWGDYFADFSVYMIDSRSNKYISGRAFEYETLEKRLSKWAITNRFKFNSYLGRINLVSLFPTGILLMGGIYGQILALQALRNSSNERKKILGLTSNIVSVTMLGFLWFLIRTPMGGPGDTLKTTYFLQIFPFLAIQSGTLIQRIQSKPILYCLGFTLVVISIHNLPAMVTHFIELPWQTKLWSW